MKLSEHQRGMLASTMSDASVAAMLGRSSAWVARARSQIAPAPIGITFCRGHVVDQVKQLLAVEPPAIPPPPASPALFPPAESPERRLRRWIDWFLAAGWRPKTIAWLFDLETADVLAEA